MKNSALGKFAYKWLVFEDLNGFFSVLFDNMTVLAFLAFVLLNTFKMPASIVYGKIFPGLAAGLCAGDLLYSWLAFRQAKTQGKNVTAMPLTVDTPTALGLAFTVLGPTYLTGLNSGLDAETAALGAWHIGMASMIYCGFFKFIFSFFGKWLCRVIPQAGLTGSLAGVGIALIGVIPFIQICCAPAVGFIALGLIFYSVFAKIKLPFNVPGIFAAVAAGALFYYILGPFNLAGQAFCCPSFSLQLTCPQPSLGFIGGLYGALNYLPVIIPFSVLASVAAVNLTNSANMEGDAYSIRDILMIDAAATAVCGLCGGVTQTTAYIGQTACHKMGCRTGYTLFTGIAVLIFALFGIIQFVVDFIPTAALSPILVFVGMQMLMQAFQYSPKIHYPAVIIALIPNVIRVLATKGDYANHGVFEGLIANLTANPTPLLDERLVIPAIGNGFILTSMLWGGLLAMLIDKRYRESVVCLLVLSVFSLFGLVHSVYPNGAMYIPWKLPNFVLQAVPTQFAMGYLLLGVLIFILSYTKSSQERIYYDEYLQ